MTIWRWIYMTTTKTVSHKQKKIGEKAKEYSPIQNDKMKNHLFNGCRMVNWQICVIRTLCASLVVLVPFIFPVVIDWNYFRSTFQCAILFNPCNWNFISFFTCFWSTIFVVVTPSIEIVKLKKRSIQYPHQMNSKTSEAIEIDMFFSCLDKARVNKAVLNLFANIRRSTRGKKTVKIKQNWNSLLQSVFCSLLWLFFFFFALV